MLTAFASIALTAILAAGEAPAVPGAAEPAASAPPAAERPVAEKEPVGALIRRSMAAYGGERAQVRLGQVRATGKVRSSLHPGEEGRLLRVFARSNRLRQEVAFPGGAPEVRVLDGARAFRYGEPAPGPVAAMLQLQAARLDLPALLLEWEARVVDQGEVTHEGQKLRVLGLEFVAGQRIEAGIDPRSGRILYVRGLARSGPRQLEVFTVYRDFRMVDGVLVPFHEEGWANGEPTGEVDLTAVEFLETVPESAFEP
jgi:hypothetical protein